MNSFDDLYHTIRICSRWGPWKGMIPFLEKIESENEHGYTPLNMACKHNDLKIIKLLLDNGASVQAKTKKGMTPIHYASKYGKLEIAKLLLDMGANIQSKNNKGVTPIDLARNGNIIELFDDVILNKNATTLQYFFRIIMSKNLVNKLRTEPDNLFDTEFSNTRKRMLKIDDSRFK